MSESAVLDGLAPVLRQLRDIKALCEDQPGSFHFGGQPFVSFHQDPDGYVAEVRALSGHHAGPTRFAVNAPPEVRKLIDEVKHRLSRLTDD